MRRPGDVGPARDSPDDRRPGGPPGPARVWLVDLDPAVAPMLAEWLAEAGIDAARADGTGDAPLPIGEPAGLVVVDLRFPRQAAAARLQAVALAWPRTPILALSGGFFAHVEAGGALARTLGVAAVMAQPVERAPWLAAVRRLLEPRR